MRICQPTNENNEDEDRDQIKRLFQRVMLALADSPQNPLSAGLADFAVELFSLASGLAWDWAGLAGLALALAMALACFGSAPTLNLGSVIPSKKSG